MASHKSRTPINSPRLASLAGENKPTFHIIATNVRKPGLASFHGSGIDVNDAGLEQFLEEAPQKQTGEYDRLSIPNIVLLSEAVAASAAFPVFFPPLILTKLRHAYDPNNPLEDYLFIDGGAVDNLGITKTLELVSRESVDLVLLSDASGAVNWDSSSFIRLAMGGSLRSVDSLMMTNNATSLAFAQSRIRSTSKNKAICFRRIGIDDPIPRNEVLPEEAGKALAGIRTDFNSFSDTEIDALVKQGQILTNQVLSEIGVTSNAESPLWTPVAGHYDRNTLVNKLKRGADRHISARTWCRWSLLGLAACGVLVWWQWPAFMEWRAYQDKRNRRAWVEEIKWAPHDHSSIDRIAKALDHTRGSAFTKWGFTKAQPSIHYTIQLHYDTVDYGLIPLNMSLYQTIQFTQDDKLGFILSRPTVWKLTQLSSPRGQPGFGWGRIEYLDVDPQSKLSDCAGATKVSDLVEQLASKANTSIPPNIRSALDELDLGMRDLAPLPQILIATQREVYQGHRPGVASMPVELELSTVGAIDLATNSSVVSNWTVADVFHSVMSGVPGTLLRWQEIELSASFPYPWKPVDLYGIAGELGADFELTGDDTDPILPKYQKAHSYFEYHARSSGMLSSLDKVEQDLDSPPILKQFAGLLRRIVMNAMRQSPTNNLDEGAR